MIWAQWLIGVSIKCLTRMQEGLTRMHSRMTKLPQTEQVNASDLKVGDELLVKVVVVPAPDDYPPGSHHHFKPTSSLVQCDRLLWTWATDQRGHDRPFTRIVKEH